MPSAAHWYRSTVWETSTASSEMAGPMIISRASRVMTSAARACLPRSSRCDLAVKRMKRKGNDAGPEQGARKGRQQVHHLIEQEQEYGEKNDGEDMRAGQEMI